MSLSYSTDQQEEGVGFWELKRGADTLARLEETCCDFPWVYCFFFPEPEFDQYRHLFTRSEGIWQGGSRELHDTISREGIHVVTREGKRLRAFTLVVDDSEARLTFTEV